MPADQIRNRTVGCKMSDSEYERLSAVVESEGMTLGEWRVGQPLNFRLAHLSSRVTDGAFGGWHSL
jgi:hypothetical protein